MKYYITGGLGVVGSTFASALLAEGHSVVILDAAEEMRNRWAAGQLRSLVPPTRLKIHIARMETADLEEALSCDAILHAAAHTGIPHSAEDPDDDWRSNVDATRHLLETLRLAARAGKLVPPTVLLSSVKPYRIPSMGLEHGDHVQWISGDGVDESCVLEPDEPYAASKMAQSALGLAYARTYALPVTVFRCSNLYGSAPCHGPRHGWLTWFCISAALQRPLEVQGDGRQTRDMLHTTDLHQAIRLAWTGINLHQGRVYNIGGGLARTLSVLQAARELGRLSGVSAHPGPGRHHEDRIFVTDTRKFAAAADWHPTIAPLKGLRATYEWACLHRDALEALYPCAK